MRDRLQREFGKISGRDISISKLYVTRVFPRKDGGLTIQYELYPRKSGSPGTEKMILCGHLLAPGGPWPDYVGNSGYDCIILDDVRLIIPIFPFDPRLKSLKRLTRFGKKSDISGSLRAILGADVELAGCEVLGYRMEKRCVLRYTVNAQNGSFTRKKVVVKAFHSSRFDKAVRILSELEKKGFNYNSPDGITIPRILRSDGELTAIFMEDIPGLSLHFLMDKAIFSQGCSAGGRALLKLHGIDTVDLKIYTISDELGNLRKLLELISNMYPEFADSFKSRFSDLSREIPEGSSKTVLSHRDFFDKQFLYSENRSALLDCDNAALADPALDAGNFIAHLILRRIQHPDCAVNIDRGIDAFIKSYDNSDRDFPERTMWWIRAALLRLSALYLLRPRWRHIGPELLTQPLDDLGKQLSGGAYDK
ncbi:MAG: phosphotransferase [Candidatus Zixiibacteriota bacterium]|nr:MAG: phosphotransferase [candidate division Zixibacteria bacterium]